MWDKNSGHSIKFYDKISFECRILNLKFIKIVLFLLFFAPLVSFGASSNDFQGAAQLLSAARRGDIQSVQNLINMGVDINYVDSSGLSLVCTAVMNNDKRTIQILQMYGADASNCDRQIKDYKRKTKIAADGEETGFFSGLSSTQGLVLNAVGVVAVVGGVVLLTKMLKDENNNSSSPSGGSHGGGGGGGGGGSASTYFTVPYGPAYLNSDGDVNVNFDVTENLPAWDTRSASELRVSDFNYLRRIWTVNDVSVSQAILEGVNPLLENYLLDMRGYYAFASGYLGQNIFRNTSDVPLLSLNGYQKQPVKVALITGNGINPAGSADFGDGIVYANTINESAELTRVDKYVNNTIAPVVDENNVVLYYSHDEMSGFDLSGSGSVFNPFANVNDSAVAKIVAGWEAGRLSTEGDLYGFVPNGQLAIYRTGNGAVWQMIPVADRQNVGTFTDSGDAGLSVGDIIEIDGRTYTIEAAQTGVSTVPTLTIGDPEVTYKLSRNLRIFIGVCDGCVGNIAIYVGDDGAWYVNSQGGNDIDNVYMPDAENIYTYKTKTTDAAYSNFSAMQKALTNDVVANVNVIPLSRQNSYLSVNNFTKAANMAGVSNLKTFYSQQINNLYGTYIIDNTPYEQGGVAHSMFNGYTADAMLVMPAGDYLLKDASSGIIYYDTLDATFENYAPMLYSSSLNHNFMTIVGVTHKNGTTSASTISGYGDGTGSGKLQLSIWYDSNSDIYSSRKCGLAGVGNAASGVDPWCFAASGPTAEMATASAAGAVASVKAAFPYMDNNKIFTLLALTADGPYLSANTDGTAFSVDTLAAYLQDMYQLPLEYTNFELTSSEYLNTFKEVFGYGLINLERAVKPGFSIYYYSDGNIVAADGTKNKFWGKLSSTSSRASTILSLTPRSSITTAFYDIVESVDGSLSLPRIWTNTFAMNNGTKHGLYMGDMLSDFRVGTNNEKAVKVGNVEFNMSMSPRAYNDNLNGLDSLRVAFTSDSFDVSGEYQRYLTDGQSRFNGRANSVLALANNVMLSDADYKVGNFTFGARAFSGAITDESLLETDPAVSAQFEPGRLGFANGGAFDTKYSNDKFGMGVSFGVMHENNTVLGMYSDGLLSMRGGNTQYVDLLATYKPYENVKLSLRGMFANTKVDEYGGFISHVSNIKSNEFAFGADVGNFGLTVAMPLAVVDGHMGYDYAEYAVVESDNGYSVALNNPHVEYVDLTPQKRELRFVGEYKRALGDWTDAGAEFMYRVNPNNTSAFGNESVLMFKVHHRMGI